MEIMKLTKKIGLIMLTLCLSMIVTLPVNAANAQRTKAQRQKHAKILVDNAFDKVCKNNKHYSFKVTGYEKEVQKELNHLIKDVCGYHTWNGKTLKNYNRPSCDKRYFKGESYGLYGIRWIMRGDVATLSGYDQTTKKQDTIASSKVKKAVKQAKKYKSKGKRIRYLYDWTKKQLRYTYSGTGYSSAKALSTGRAVCHGYAQSYIWVLKKAGINAHYTVCRRSTILHAIVRIGHKYYDASSDDGSHTGHLYYGKTKKQMRKLGTIIK